MLVAAAIGMWAVFVLALAQGGTSWLVIFGFGAILLVTTALALNSIGMAVGPNEILLTRDRMTIRRGFESVSVPWSAITRLEDRRDKVNAVRVQFLEVHVRQRSDIAYGGFARIISRLSRSSSPPVVLIALRSGITLLVGHEPDEAAGLIRRYLANYAARTDAGASAVARGAD